MESQLCYWLSELKERESKRVPNACIPFFSWHSNNTNNCHCICMHACTKYTHSRTRALMHTHLRTHARTHAHTRTHTNTHTHTCIYIYICIYSLWIFACKYARTSTHPHVDTDIHTYVHACVIYMMVYSWILKPTRTGPNDGTEQCSSSLEGWSNPIVTDPPATLVRAECPSTSANGIKTSCTQSVQVCKGLAAPLAMHGFFLLSNTESTKLLPQTHQRLSQLDTAPHWQSLIKLAIIWVRKFQFVG